MGGGTTNEGFGPEILEILLALEDGPAHGFLIVQTVHENTGGRISLAPSLLYRRLRRLRDDGLVADAGSAPGLRGKARRLYVLTDTGRERLRAEATRLIELAQSDRLRRVLNASPGRLT